MNNKKTIEAVEKSIIVWKEIVRTNVDRKKDLNEEFFDLVKDEKFNCPLCTIFYECNYFGVCTKCPLESCDVYTSFDNWCTAVYAPEDEEYSKEDAKQYSQEILSKLEKWLEENR
jgi:hypothetical protein